MDTDQCAYYNIVNLSEQEDNTSISSSSECTPTSSQASETKRALSFIVIGAGLIGPRHASHLVSRPDVLLFAIIDHSAKGPHVAAQFNCLLFKNLDEMFDYCAFQNASLPDAAIIATPNHTHVPLGLKLAAKGVHLLVEKPLAPTPQDCMTLIRACQHYNVKLLVGHHRRFNPYIVTTKDNLHRLGDLVAMQGTWSLKKPDLYYAEKPWRSSKELGGGAMLINLIHDLDLLQYMMGPVDKVYAELLMKQRTNHPNNSGKEYSELVDEGAALTLRFKNGCCGTFICSDNVTSPFSFEAGTGENPTIPFNDSIAGFYRIFGSEGTLSVPDLKLYHQYNLPASCRNWLNPVQCDQVAIDTSKMKLPEKELSTLSLTEIEFGLPTPLNSLDGKADAPIHHRRDNDPAPIPLPDELPMPFDLQIDHFINLINGTETEVKCSGEDALRALLCIDAVMKSAETGMPQFVEDIDMIDINRGLLGFAN